MTNDDVSWTGYGYHYGESFGGTNVAIPDNPIPENPEETNMNVLELNDHLVITMESQMLGTEQEGEENLYVHILPDDSLTLVQQGDDVTAEAVAITAKGIDLLRRVLATLPGTDINEPVETEPTE